MSATVCEVRSQIAIATAPDTRKIKPSSPDIHSMTPQTARKSNTLVVACTRIPDRSDLILALSPMTAAVRSPTWARLLSPELSAPRTAAARRSRTQEPQRSARR